MTTQIQLVSQAPAAAPAMACHCNGCATVSLPERLVVPGVLWLAQCLGKDVERLTSKDVLATALCRRCVARADSNVRGEFKYSLDKVLAQVAQSEAARQRQLDWQQRERAKLAAAGGSHGNPSEPKRPVSYLKKKAERSERDRILRREMQGAGAKGKK